MDERHNNIDPGNRSGMNGRDEPMTNAEERAVFAHLYALDQQPDPSPQFVARLGKSLMSPAERMTLSSATTSTEEPMQLPQPQTETSGGGKRRRPLISFGSAAVLLVLVVLVGYIVTLWAVNDSGGGPANMALAPTFESSSTAVSTGCLVEPLELSYVTRLVGYAVNGLPEDGVFEMPDSTPDTSTGVAPVPGEPASLETVERITAVYDQYIDCRNDRDYLRMYALFTDDGIARSLAPNGEVNTWGLAQLSAPPEPGYVSIRRVIFERVETLSDGRVVAYPPGEEVPENYAIFKYVDGHWLIDDVFETHG